MGCVSINIYIVANWQNGKNSQIRAVRFFCRKVPIILSKGSDKSIGRLRFFYAK